MTPMGLTSRAVQSSRRSGWRTTAACRASRQGGSGARPAARHEASERTDQAGRGAGRGNDAVSHGCTRDGSAPISSSTARARPHQVVAPPPAACRVPGGADGAGEGEQAVGEVAGPGRRAVLVVHDGRGCRARGRAGRSCGRSSPRWGRRPTRSGRSGGRRAGPRAPAPPPRACCGRRRPPGRRGPPAPEDGARRPAADPGRSRWRRGPCAAPTSPHAAASRPGASAFTAQASAAASGSVSARSTAVNADALSSTAGPSPAPRPACTASRTAAGSVTSSSARVRATTPPDAPSAGGASGGVSRATSSLPRAPPAPVTIHRTRTPHPSITHGESPTGHGGHRTRRVTGRASRPPPETLLGSGFLIDT